MVEELLESFKFDDKLSEILPEEFLLEYKYFSRWRL